MLQAQFADSFAGFLLVAGVHCYRGACWDVGIAAFACTACAAFGFGVGAGAGVFDFGVFVFGLVGELFDAWVRHGYGWGTGVRLEGGELEVNVCQWLV